MSETFAGWGATEESEYRFLELERKFGELGVSARYVATPVQFVWLLTFGCGEDWGRV